MITPRLVQRLIPIVALLVVIPCANTFAADPPQVICDPGTGILIPRYDSSGRLIGWKYAYQGNNCLSLDVLDECFAGCRVFRLGICGASAAGEAQFWFTPSSNPMCLRPVEDMGFPAGKACDINFLCTGRLRPGAPYVTRPLLLGGGVVSVVNGEVVDDAHL